MMETEKISPMIKKRVEAKIRKNTIVAYFLNSYAVFIISYIFQPSKSIIHFLEYLIFTLIMILLLMLVIFPFVWFGYYLPIMNYRNVDWLIELLVKWFVPLWPASKYTMNMVENRMTMKYKLKIEDDEIRESKRKFCANCGWERKYYKMLICENCLADFQIK